MTTPTTSAWGTTDMETMPERLRDRVYYEPGAMGFEKDIRQADGLVGGGQSEDPGGSKAEAEGVI